MKQRIFTWFQKLGIQKPSNRQLTIAFGIWLLPLGTLWVAIYLLLLHVSSRLGEVIPR